MVGQNGDHVTPRCVYVKAYDTQSIAVEKLTAAASPDDREP